jgi:hypothetical protein
VRPAAAAGATRLPAELNTLRAAHGEEAFLAALDRAAAFCRWHAADVRSILSAGAGLPGPKAAPGDALVLDLPAVPVRPRDASNARTRMKNAAFPVIKRLGELDRFACSSPGPTLDYLASLEWITAAENPCLAGPVVIHGIPTRPQQCLRRGR